MLFRATGGIQCTVSALVLPCRGCNNIRDSIDYEGIHFVLLAYLTTVIDSESSLS